MNYLKKFILLIYFRIEYIVTAYISFIILKLKGTNYLKRTRNRNDIKELKQKIEKNDKKRLAIFVAFHSPSRVPKSNLNYIDILNKCSFNIVYIINGKLKSNTLKQLNNIGCYVICRDNIGQDFGAWKDGIALLQKYKISDQIKWLLLCNDSNFCLGGKNSDDFVAKFSKALESHKSSDFIGLNCSYERSFHYQSYFLCLSNLIIQKKSFKSFWEKYLPLNHRFHAIKSGEIKLTTKVLKNFRPNIIYTKDRLSKNISSNLKKEYDLFLKNLPNSLSLIDANFVKNYKHQKDNKLEVLNILDSLESYNPSHVFGLLNIVYLKAPFLKKDLIRQGVFSNKQICEILNLESLNIEDDFKKEIIDIFFKDAKEYHNMRSIRSSYRKGIKIR